MPRLEQRKYKWRLAMAVIILALVSWYGFYQAQDLIFGPRLTIDQPKDGYITDQPAIKVTGQAFNAKDLKLNGRSIVLSPAGQFKEYLPLSARYNIIRLEGEDIFGHRTKIERLVVSSEPIPSLSDRHWSDYLEELKDRATETDPLDNQPNDIPVEILEAEEN